MAFCAPIAKEGDRVQIHPGTDWWMRGARYGEVAAVIRKGCEVVAYRVRLDATNKLIRLRAQDISEVLDPPVRPRTNLSI